VLTALGVLIAIAVTLIILTQSSAANTTVATPVTASDSGGSVPHVRYLGPHQIQAAALSMTTAHSGSATGHTTAATPVTASDSGGSVPNVRYLGPRQFQAAALSMTTAHSGSATGDAEH
jgi:hypothetical protein